MSRADEILDFWFGGDPVTVQDRQRLWFSANPTLDQLCTERFAVDHEAAAAGRFDNWKGYPRSCLALVLLLDQFPRNMFRRTPRAFATDLQALNAALHAIANGFDRKLPALQRAFFYLPFEHSEALANQEESVRFATELAQKIPIVQAFSSTLSSIARSFVASAASPIATRSWAAHLLPRKLNSCATIRCSEGRSSSCDRVESGTRAVCRASSESLTGQVLRLYDGYRTLLMDLIARAQEKGLCTREFPPQVAASFLLSMLNGMLIGFLLGNRGVDLEGAMAMLRQWLFPNDRSRG
jgi:uncharacterized protein (DUF924 family)